MAEARREKQKNFLLNHTNPRPFNFYESFNYRKCSSARRDYRLQLNQVLQEAPQSEKLLNLKRSWENNEYDSDLTRYEDEKNIRRADVMLKLQRKPPIDRENQIVNIDNKENEDGSETEEVKIATEEINIMLRIRQDDGASFKKKELFSTNITECNVEELIPVEECEEMGYVINNKQIRKSIQSTNANNKDELEIADLTEFDRTYCNLDPQKMWKLKSSTIVEKVIYEHARNLTYESCLHSYIISDVDKEAMTLFSQEDWNEIFSFEVKKFPNIDSSIINLMKDYSVTDLSKIMHMFWEADDNFALDSSKSEEWYQLNLW
ncbi:6670_t:CDS:2, partial [Gigaspora rosea]